MPFRTIVGHRLQVALLSRAIARGTLPPALLLAGPRGIGKHRAAQAIAETLNCTKVAPAGELEADACGACPQCRRISRGVHPDVVLLEPDDSGSIKTDTVRGVISAANYRPFEGRRRVVILDDADALEPQAQSALLKTLEEPPPASVFVLVSSKPDALLPTVLSRCRPLRLGELKAVEVAEVLTRDHKYSEANASAAASDAGGSVSRALEARDLDLGAAREAALRVLREAARVDDPARRLATAQGLVVAKSTGKLHRDREYLAVRLRALSSLLRDAALLADGAESTTVANADLAADLCRLGDTLGRKRAAKAFMAVDEALGALDRHVGPKVVADWLILRI
jgi:DNA polymerase-3 subunit delta'